MVHGKNRIPYWIDRRLTGLAGPEYHAIISFGLPFESEDCQYGKSQLQYIPLAAVAVHPHTSPSARASSIRSVVQPTRVAKTSSVCSPRLGPRFSPGLASEMRINTDQGSQFTSDAFTGLLKANGIQISMDGKGGWKDNVFVERLWKSVKYKEVYLRAYESVPEARTGLGRYFEFYNAGRPHSSLGGMTPDQFFDRVPAESEAA